MIQPEDITRGFFGVVLGFLAINLVVWAVAIFVAVHFIVKLW